MSIRNAVVLLFAFSALALLAGCGSSSNSATPPPTGRFGNNSLSGTYVFSFSGADITDTAVGGGGSFFAVVGTLSANGGGGITSGSIDIVDPSLAAAAGAGNSVQTGLSTTGSYSVTADGRGSGTITVTINGQAVKLGLDFVLTSSSHGLITRFDTNGTGSGTIDLQSSVSQSSLGSYAFSFSGVDGGGNPFATAGAFSVGNTGTITTGLQDFNDDRNSLTNASLTGSVLVGSAGAAGTAVLTATGSPYGTQFDVWPVDATHLKFIETDGVDILEGDAFTQQTTISSGQLVYTMAGLDTSGFLLSAGGFMAYDGSSVIGPNGVEDINDGVSSTLGQSLIVGGTLTPTGGGRYNLSLANFFNGTGGASTSASPFVFAAYPSSSGILLMEIDNSGVTAGTAFTQTAQTFASSKGYGLNLTGENPVEGIEVDQIAEFTANSGGTLSNGLIDENDEGTLAFDQQLGTGGTYAFDPSSTGRGELSYPATKTTLIGALNLIFYVADSSNVIFIDADAGAQVGVGSFQLQNAPASSSLALAHTQSHFSMLGSVAALRSRRKN